nr:MAG TPA: hypothetical protein [Caudoviricetes sp.]
MEVLKNDYFGFFAVGRHLVCGRRDLRRTSYDHIY